ncbi:MAG: DUF3046 domain-containing protein [Corynebacterium sp.]|uniref:DUF3046 domain-containing protein n=1 Tax=Corynebacterium sp. TaxID=1720 RepID=UPI0026DB9B48|nr:DUF3046 domain-containing protein [Corynebacterium sp.]MDO5098048.1 DUF3046 domain-containing protein [Corynebacterium sp.]
MRLTQFQKLITDEFGDQYGAWIVHSHVVSGTGKTPNVLIEEGMDPAEVWEKMCDDFQIPAERRLGNDD